MPRQFIHEITPLAESDALYIADRHKKEFDYPIHNHDVYELNFVENAAGVRRVVGDSTEIIGDLDLVLITSPDLEHVWEQNTCHSDDIREITVQFRFGMEEDGFFGKNPFRSIRYLMKTARRGLAFPRKAILHVYDKLDNLSSQKDGFSALMTFMEILHELSLCKDAHTLATTSFAKVQIEDDSRRILKVKNYISEHYMDELKLDTLSELANMSQSAFSRYFKMHTGRTLSDYIIDVRLGNATRMLVDNQDSISDICYRCGYSSLSNFNRIFKRKKGSTPSEFRSSYQKIKIIV